MVLPPLELFSLREELPCCRAALSVFWALNGRSIPAFRPDPRLGLRPARSIACRRLRRARSWTARHSRAQDLLLRTSDISVVRRPGLFSRRFVKNILRDGLRDNLSRFFRADPPRPPLAGHRYSSPVRATHTSAIRYRLAATFRKWQARAFLVVAFAQRCLPGVLQRRSVVSTVFIRFTGVGIRIARIAKRRIPERLRFCQRTLLRSARLRQPSIPQFVPQYLLRGLRQIAETGRQLIEFSVEHHAIVLGECLPVLTWVLVHGKQYSGISASPSAENAAARKTPRGQAGSALPAASATIQSEEQ